jgi:hypothetical protein
MDMGLRVLVAVGVVLKERDDKVAGLDGLHLAVGALHARFGEVLFGPCNRCLRGLHIGFEQAFVTADIGEHRQGLWRREGHVEADRAFAVLAARKFGAVGHLAVKDGLEFLDSDLAGQAGFFGAVACPEARLLRSIGGVVIVLWCSSSRPRPTNRSLLPKA